MENILAFIDQKTINLLVYIYNSLSDSFRKHVIKVVFFFWRGGGLKKTVTSLADNFELCTRNPDNFIFYGHMNTVTLTHMVNCICAKCVVMGLLTIKINCFSLIDVCSFVQREG